MVINSKGNESNDCKSATVPSSDALSATTTSAGGRVWAASARTQATAVADRFMVAKIAVIFGWLFKIPYAGCRFRIYSDRKRLVPGEF